MFYLQLLGGILLSAIRVVKAATLRLFPSRVVRGFSLATMKATLKGRTTLVIDFREMLLISFGFEYGICAYGFGDEASVAFYFRF